MRFSYQPGSGTAVCGPDTAALVSLSPTHPLIGRLAAAAASAISADDLVEVLLSPGLRAVSDFLIIERGASGPRVVVRGRYVADLVDGGRIAGSGLLTDKTLPTDTEIAAHAGTEPTGVRLPLKEGVVLADRIWLGGFDAAGDGGPVADADAGQATDLLSGSVPRLPEPEPASWTPLPQVHPAGPTVLAARCPRDHLNPPYLGLCRVCGEPILAQRATEVPRPSLGVLRLSTGDVVMLDRGIVLGRHPRLPENHDGEPVQLVTLSDPNRDTSSMHLEVILDGWNVLVRDLGSTNGTRVVLPGATPVTLRAREPFLIEPGTKVVLAGVIDLFWDPAG